MAKNRTPEQIISYEFEQLEKLIKNLLVNNINFKTGYYFNKEFTRTFQYVKGPLKEHADYILERLNKTKELVVGFVEDDNE